MRIEKRNEFKHRIDWPLKTLKDLGRLYQTNGSEITVRSVNYTSDPVVFTWTNDSLPTNYCPNAEIKKLFDVSKKNISIVCFKLNLLTFCRSLQLTAEEILHPN